MKTRYLLFTALLVSACANASVPSSSNPAPSAEPVPPPQPVIVEPPVEPPPVIAEPPPPEPSPPATVVTEEPPPPPAPLTGCGPEGRPCPSGQKCCRGVPYPQHGACHPQCLMKSDRDAKQGFDAVDADAVLADLAALPITSWSYREEGTSTRHLGPTAQDFRAAFGLGRDDRAIDTVDASGVALAAIQALYHRVQRLEEDNARLRAALVARGIQ